MLGKGVIRCNSPGRLITSSCVIGFIQCALGFVIWLVTFVPDSKRAVRMQDLTFIFTTSMTTIAEQDPG